MTTVEITHARRERIDALLKAAEGMIKSAETQLAFRSLQSAKHNLGNYLKLTGGTTPYKKVDKATDIPPTADVSENPAFELSEDHLENVNKMRELIDEELTKFKMEYHFDLLQNKMTFPAFQLYQHHSNLLQAGNWYGEQLSQMRQKAKEEVVKTAVSEAKKEEERGEPAEKEAPTKKKTTTKKVVDKSEKKDD